jgi:hypothetical protein
MKPATLLCLGFMMAYTDMAQAAPLDSKVLEEAKDFLKKHLHYYNTGNIGLAKLYSKDAEIALTITKQNNHTINTVLSGQAWIQRLREAWGSGRAANEAIELHNVTINGDGASLDITAQRYSKTRCYWDNNYKISITKNGLPSYRIIKETALINHNNLCPQPSLEEFLINQNIQVAPP